MYALRRADFAARQSKSILETILGGNYKILDEQRERLKRVFEARCGTAYSQRSLS